MSFCALSSVASTLASGLLRKTMWTCATLYGLKNFLSGPQSIGRIPFSHSLYNLGLTSLVLPLAYEGLARLAERYYYTECADPKTREVAKPFFK